MMGQRAIEYHAKLQEEAERQKRQAAKALERPYAELQPKPEPVTVPLKPKVRAKPKPKSKRHK